MQKSIDYRCDRRLFWLGMACTAIFITFGVGSFGVAYANLDGSFSTPKESASSAPSSSICGPRPIRRINRNAQPCCDAQSSEVQIEFSMPHGLHECELAMTVILKFYDGSNVCRNF